MSLIPYDENWTFDPDCSTCAHKVKRHVSRRSTPVKPRRLDYVCLVTGKAIGEHGTFMQSGGFNDQGVLECRWVQDVPCKVNLHDGRGWFALDYDSIEED